MSDEDKSRSVPATDNPSVIHSVVPIWIIVITLILLFLGGYYFDTNSGWFDKQVYAPYKSAEVSKVSQPKNSVGYSAAHGEAIYNFSCGSCHGADGLGKPGLAPPLAGSEWVTTKKFNRLALITLQGLSGPIKVAGKDWNLAMPPMGASLPDPDLADALTHVRVSWGNKASPVTSDDIQKIQASMGGSPKPIPGPELPAVPE